MELRELPYELTICKVESIDSVSLADDFLFVGKTADEISLVCETSRVPSATTEREDGWRGLVICGKLDFSLVGILSRISTVLAESGVGIFAVSTYNTDYVLVKAENLERAEIALAAAGYDVVRPSTAHGEATDGHTSSSISSSSAGNVEAMPDATDH